MAEYVITYGDACNYLEGGDTITASSLTAAKRKATRLGHEGYDINIWDCNQVQRLSRRRWNHGLSGRPGWGAWFNI